VRSNSRLFASLVLWLSCIKQPAGVLHSDDVSLLRGVLAIAGLNNFLFDAHDVYCVFVGLDCGGSKCELNREMLRKRVISFDVPGEDPRRGSGDDKSGE
jgi:hypothetical protein